MLSTWKIEHYRRLNFSKIVRLCKNFVHKDSATTPEIDTIFSNGRNLTISTGKYARFCDGSAVAKIGDTSVMVTAVSKPKSHNVGNFLPLVVDYKQKSAAAGRIPTNFLRRELGPTETDILTSRLIDRCLRPLFPPNYLNETQLVCNSLAVDSIYNADVPAINAASAALSLSDIPWNGPIGAVRIGLKDSELIVNPTRIELQKSTLDLIVCATKQNLVVMLEGKADNILQQDLLKAVKFGTREAQGIISSIEKLQKSHGKTKRELNILPEVSDDLISAIKSLSEMRIREIFRNYNHDKISRDNELNLVRSDIVEKVRASFTDIEPTVIVDEFNKISKKIFRDLIFEDDIRCDGRNLNQLRNISCDVNLYKPLHGSALFQRGQTQVLCTVALDSPDSALKLDTSSMLTSDMKVKKFFLHYEFPPYATGDIGRIGPLGRRELGHGALAERGLAPLVPSDYPFTIRLTSEVLESNGSSSMASVCGGCLALLDAGVPLKSSAAGVAIGLIARYPPGDTKHIEEYRLLTDLLGIEDYLGDMDMKVAGTRKGFTALQADIKIPGLPLKIVMEALQAAADANCRILDIMEKCIDKPRKVKDNWPVSETLEVEISKRSKLFGAGASNLKKIYLETGVEVTQQDDTTFSLFAPSKLALDEAKSMIQDLLDSERVPELEFGAIYSAKIVEIRDIGVMVQLYKDMPPALLHNSQLDHRKVSHPSALGLEVGNEIQVKYFGRDPVSGLIRLSRKVLLGISGPVKSLIIK
ncbi:polyribonucleotide nucleotidyltransferase 1, mitochondrial-like [Ctenocephalides felis]|uniref:polyribonucleotide nucleotidyltransferase 1, mitochondrial-like n=1 Tax=Ctenocephalides felis TaxID=7515 RepID=UPI000E6E30F3|nr:polyribonucleotide nucleotidyltransferase 1, mitochondrial-like [Ctenocephalides felis]